MLLPLLRSKAERIGPGVVLGGHVLLVVFSARLFGLWQEALFASLGVLIVAAVAYSILRVLSDHTDAASSTSITR